MATLARLDIVISANSAGAARGMAATTRGLQTMERQAARTSRRMFDLGTIFRAVFAIEVVRRIGRATKAVFDLGASVEETQSKFSTVFAQSRDDVQGFLDTFAHHAGLTNREAQELLATTGAIAQGMGFAVEESAAYAQTVAKLAADIASFNNVAGGSAEVIRALNSAAAGEREPLKRFGIQLLEAEVQARALLETGKTLTSELTQQDKVMASLSLITEKAGVAVGDLDRTQESAANTARRVGARFRELKEQLASATIPVLGQMLSALDDNAGAFETLTGWVAAFAKFMATGVAVIQIFGSKMAVMAAQVEVAWAKVRDVIARQLLGREGLLGMINRFEEFMAGAPVWLKALLGIPGFAANRTANFLTDLVEQDTAGALRAAEQNLERMQAAADATIQEILQELNAALAQQGAGGQAPPRTSTDGVDVMIKKVSELQQAATNFVDDFQSRLGAFLAGGEDAFRGFANSVISELNRIAIKLAIISAVRALAPNNDTLLSIVGASPPQGRGTGGMLTPFQPVKLHRDEVVVPMTPSMAISPSVAAAGVGGGPVFNITVPLTVSSLTPNDARQAVESMRPVIADSVVDAIRNSGAVRAVLRNR